MNEINYIIAKDMIRNLPGYKREILEKARDRHFNFTSDSVIHDIVLLIYNEGYELICVGCQTTFTCYYKDNDGTLEFVKRKPNKDKLNYLYTDYGYVEDEFYN